MAVCQREILMSTVASKWLATPRLRPHGMRTFVVLTLALLLLGLLPSPGHAAKTFDDFAADDGGMQAWQKRRLTDAYPSAHGRLLGEFGIVTGETEASTGSSGSQEEFERVDWRARAVPINLGSRYCQQSPTQACGPCNQLPNDPCQVRSSG